MTRKPALGRGLDALIGAGARRRDSLELAAGSPQRRRVMPLQKRPLHRARSASNVYRLAS